MKINNTVRTKITKTHNISLTREDILALVGAEHEVPESASVTVYYDYGHERLEVGEHESVQTVDINWITEETTTE